MSGNSLGENLGSWSTNIFPVHGQRRFGETDFTGLVENAVISLVSEILQNNLLFAGAARSQNGEVWDTYIQQVGQQ